VLSYYFSALALFFILLYRKMITARFHPANWLVRLTDEGMFIKFRSYLNNHFPDNEPTVVYIPHFEIRSARHVIEKQNVSDRDTNNRRSSVTKANNLVELELAGDTKQLAEALQRERHYAIGGSGTLKIVTRYQHLPVRLPTAEKLQIEWAVTPNAQTLLNALTRHTLVRSTEETSKDFVNLDKLSREEQETRLLELAETGDKIGAIAMARRLYAYDLTQAKQFVDGLVSKRSP
jgi:ribosomal protein L7/L12